MCAFLLEDGIWDLTFSVVIIKTPQLFCIKSSPRRQILLDNPSDPSPQRSLTFGQLMLVPDQLRLLIASLCVRLFISFSWTRNIRPEQQQHQVSIRLIARHSTQGGGRWSSSRYSDCGDRSENQQILFVFGYYYPDKIFCINYGDSHRRIWEML